MQPRNRARLANVLTIALLALFVLTLIVAVPLDLEASYGLTADAIVVALTCLYAWQPTQAAHLLDRKTLGAMGLLGAALILMYAATCMVAGLDVCCTELNGQLRFDSERFAGGLPVKMGMVLLMLAITLLAREAMLRLIERARRRKRRRR